MSSEKEKQRGPRVGTFSGRDYHGQRVHGIIYAGPDDLILAACRQGRPVDWARETIRVKQNLESQGYKDVTVMLDYSAALAAETDH